MSDEDKDPTPNEPGSETQPGAAAEGKAGDAEPSAASSAGETGANGPVTREPAEPEAPQDPLDAAKAEAAKYRDQLLRTAADFDNFRKRARRDQEDERRRGRDSVIRDLLPVFDNLQRAVSHAASTPETKALVDGLGMVMRQFEQTLDKLGIKRVEAVGQPFDPLLHEAIQHIESTEHAAGVITNEVQTGYKSGDQLIRAALVVVSKGPPADAPKDEN